MKKFALKLNRWAAELERAAAEAVFASAGRGADAAKKLAPVKSGELRQSIGVRREGDLQAAVIAAAPHSAMVEYGTSRAPAQPFMLPMAREVSGEFAAALRKAAREVLK